MLSLAPGVGVNSVVFGLVDGLFLRPLPVCDPASLARIDWQGADGRTLRLNNRSFTVVGILPLDFRGLSRMVVTHIWVPVSTWRAMGNAKEFEERVAGQFGPIARLKADATLAAAQAQLDTFAQRVAIVSLTMARQYWPAGAAVGQSIRVDKEDVQIVGIAEDTVINSFHEAPLPYIYFPFAQSPAGEMTFIFETIGEPAGLIPAVKAAMRAIAPGHAQLTLNTLKQHVRDALYQDWMQAVLSIAIAAIGMALATVGIVGVVTHAATRRRREIGIRTALGARRRDVVVMVLRAE